MCLSPYAVRSIGNVDELSVMCLWAKCTFKFEDFGCDLAWWVISSSRSFLRCSKHEWISLSFFNTDMSRELVCYSAEQWHNDHTLRWHFWWWWWWNSSGWCKNFFQEGWVVSRNWRLENALNKYLRYNHFKYTWISVYFSGRNYFLMDFFYPSSNFSLFLS